MRNLLNFLLEIGKLKKIKRRGITFYGVKTPDSATDHCFRMAIMAWLLGARKNIKIEKALKLVLIHDICKILTGDITPYNGFLPRCKKEKDRTVRRWVRLPLCEKKKRYDRKFKKEYAALKELTAKLPKRTKKEIINLWLDYHKMKSNEARFVHQVDVTENLLEALECRKKDKKFPTMPWWEHIDEAVDEPSLLKLLQEIEKEELRMR